VRESRRLKTVAAHEIQREESEEQAENRRDEEPSQEGQKAVGNVPVKGDAQVLRIADSADLPHSYEQKHAADHENRNAEHERRVLLPVAGG
jgi:hypothetical protein